MVLTSAWLRCVDVSGGYGTVSMRHLSRWDEGTGVTFRCLNCDFEVDMG
jgi:hypothetical protein